MNKPLDPNVVLCEGGILPKVLPNPQTYEDYVKLFSAPPIPIEKFYATKETLEMVAADTDVRLVPNTVLSVSQTAQSVLGDSVKNAKVDDLLKASRITVR